MPRGFAFPGTNTGDLQGQHHIVEHGGVGGEEELLEHEPEVLVA
jgi:hypothetical protein